MTMSDVFRARFDGLEWWAREDLDSGVALFTSREPGIMASYRVPAHMVERVEDIPPEPTEPGTVMYDRDDVSWRRNTGDEWSGIPVNEFNFHAWPTLVRDHGPLHPYPRAAREEIERLTAERDEAAGEADSEGRHVTALQERIDRALAVELRPNRYYGAALQMLNELRGEVDQ
jgi:hypothetical protein